MKSIIVKPGYIVLVDDSDYEFVSQFKWHLVSGKYTTYATRHLYVNNKRTTRTMHLDLIHPPTGFEVDHKDRNGLNNQRDNLRIATLQQNQGNTNKWNVKNPTSKYKGVSANGRGQWRASIFLMGKAYRIGDYATQEEAAIAYDARAKLAFKEFARTNF